MNKFPKILRESLVVLSLMILSTGLAAAQQARGTLRGLVTDELGGAVVGASVLLNDATGTQKAATTTNDEGVYTFTGVQPGKYFLLASAPGFGGSQPAEIELTAGGRQTLDLVLRVTIEEKVTVAAETPLSIEATNNANQTLISGKDLDALPDDPDELAAALQALAGPSVGPNGGQIFIDGFSGGSKTWFQTAQGYPRKLLRASERRTPETALARRERAMRVGGLRLLQITATFGLSRRNPPTKFLDR